jgi:uncharacterized protein (TIGR02246 family)
MGSVEHSDVIGSDDKAAVMAALDGIHAAFGKRDPAAFKALSLPDFVFIGSTEGEEAIGPDAIPAMFKAIVGSLAGAKFAVEWESLETEVIGDVALITGLGKATYETQYRLARNRYRLTGLLRRSSGKWLWRLYHASEPLPW